MSIKSVITLLGSAQDVEREKDNLYTTDPVATNKLLDAYNFSKVWECAAGLRDMSKIFDAKGILSKESDLHSRDLVDSIDFLTYSGGWDGDIVTNPPYKHALEFVKKRIPYVSQIIGRLQCYYAFNFSKALREGSILSTIHLL
jgi:hypothetical protein